MESYGVIWEGPIPFTSVTLGKGIPKSFEGPGIYIWGVSVAGKHVAYYVGETGRSIRGRTIEHLKAYIHGEYRVYDPALFRKGIKKLPPMWGDAYGARWPQRVPDFLRQIPKLAPAIADFVGLIDVFAIPMEKPLRVRKRLEAKINRLCITAAGDLQDEDIKYHPTQPDEKPISIRLDKPIPIAGLDETNEIII